jgi:hypothetical protein
MTSSHPWTDSSESGRQLYKFYTVMVTLGEGASELGLALFVIFINGFIYLKYHRQAIRHWHYSC